MTQDAMTARIRRWQLVTLAVLALLVGYLAGQVAPAASAQPAGSLVLLNTGNCRTGSAGPGTMYQPDVVNVPDGAIVTAVYMTQDRAGRPEPRFIYTVCR